MDSVPTLGGDQWTCGLTTTSSVANTECSFLCRWRRVRVGRQGGPRLTRTADWWCCNPGGRRGRSSGTRRPGGGPFPGVRVYGVSSPSGLSCLPFGHFPSSFGSHLLPVFACLFAIFSLSLARPPRRSLNLGHPGDPISGDSLVFAHCASAHAASAVSNSVGSTKGDHVSRRARIEGTTSEGDFHEALNIASVWNLPVIFLVENKIM